MAEKKDGDEENGDDKSKLIEGDDVDKKDEDAEKKEEDEDNKSENKPDENNVKVAEPSSVKSRFVSLKGGSFNFVNIITFMVVLIIPIIMELTADGLQPVFFRNEVAFPIGDVMNCTKGNSEFSFVNSQNDWKNAKTDASSHGRRLCST